MRCHICDRTLEKIEYNRDHQDFDPCGVCFNVIQDILNGYKDKPYADEDDFSDEDIRLVYQYLGFKYEED